MANEDLKPPKRYFPMQGVEVWKNPKNGFCVVELHYTADPSKRSAEWLESVKAKMPLRKFQREYELSWETWAGKPVYPDWETNYHGVKGPIDPHAGLPLLRGWDFGLTPAAIVCQLQEETLCGIHEFVGFNIGLERFSEIVLKQCALLFPNWADVGKDWMEVIDPSGEARKDTDEKSCADLLRAKGLRVYSGPVAWEARKQAVEHFLCKRTKSRPGLQVSLDNCPTLVRGFKGGYQYPEKVEEIEPNKLRPLKNKFSHVHDAFQMVASRFRVARKRSHRRIPTVRYGFQGRNR